MKFAMAKKIDITGSTFGRLTVLGENGNTPWGQAKWLCVCQCGNKITKIGGELRRGKSKSCGCLHLENLKRNFTTHGHLREGKHSATYISWANMKARCLNLKNKGYHNYGGRGISICEHWINSFDAFLKDMGPKPSLLHTLERIENNGNYEPANCKWATREEQCRNKRTTRWFEFDGKKSNFKEWASFFNVSRSFLWKELKKKPFEEIYNEWKAKQ